MIIIDYKFICPKCNDNIELTILAKDYVMDSYRCEQCGEILKRDLNDIGRNSIWKCGGAFGKSINN